MTRSQTNDTHGKDKHHQRSGMKDPRGLPKKHGAGKGNWGSELTDEQLEFVVESLIHAERHHQQEVEPKVKVVSQPESSSSTSKSSSP